MRRAPYIVPVVLLLVACGGRTEVVGSSSEARSAPSASASASSSVATTGTTIAVSAANSGAFNTSAPAVDTTTELAPLVGPLDGGPDGSWGTGWCQQTMPETCSPAVPSFVLPKPGGGIENAPGGTVGSTVGCQYFACVAPGRCVTCACVLDAGAAEWACY